MSSFRLGSTLGSAQWSLQTLSAWSCLLCSWLFSLLLSPSLEAWNVHFITSILHKHSLLRFVTDLHLGPRTSKGVQPTPEVSEFKCVSKHEIKWLLTMYNVLKTLRFDTSECSEFEARSPQSPGRAVSLENRVSYVNKVSVWPETVSLCITDRYHGWARQPPQSISSTCINITITTKHLNASTEATRTPTSLLLDIAVQPAFNRENITESNTRIV